MLELELQHFSAKIWSSSYSLQSQFPLFQKNEARSGGHPMCFHRNCRSKLMAQQGSTLFQLSSSIFFQKNVELELRQSGALLWLGWRRPGVCVPGCPAGARVSGGLGGEGPPAFESGVCVVASVPPTLPPAHPQPLSLGCTLLAPQSLRHEWLIRFGACPAFLSQPLR